jgi:nucleoside-diphosphate-sugar epimerase
MKYFLTGATGFIGGRIAKQLRAQGHEVIAVVRTPDKAQDLVALGVQLAKGDVTEKESMRAPMTGVDGVYHVAGWYKVGVKDKTPGVAININGTRNVLELMKELGIRKGVYTSTLAINSNTHGQEVDETYRFTGQHLSEYDRTKAEAHHIAEQFIREGLPLVVVMPGLVYGPDDTSGVRTSLIQFLQRKLPMIPQTTAFSWGHVDDIARAHLLAMEQGKAGESYMICGPTHTFVEAMQMASDITGVPAPMSVPGEIMNVASFFAGLAEGFLTLPETYTAEGLRIVAGVTYIGNNAKAKRELGYAPRALRDGLKETLEHEMKLLGMTRS